MLFTSPPLWLALAVVGLGVLFVVAWRSRAVWDEPGGELFTAVVLFTVAGYVASTVIVRFELGANSAVWHVLMTGFHLLFPVVWVAFAAEQKGLRFATRRRFVAVGVLLTLSMAGATSGYHALEAGLLVLPGTISSLSSTLFLTVGNLASLTSMAFLVFGVGLFFHSAGTYGHLDYWEAATPAVAAVAPWMHLVVLNLQAASWTPTAAMVVVTTAIAISAAGFGLTLARTRLFDRPVAAGTIARDRVVETMEDAVIVVDDGGRVLDINPVARRLFEVENAVGTPVGQVVGEPLDELRTRETIELESLVGYREFEPRASVVVGMDDDLVGFSIVLRDVTERRTREERLQVLNRVLRHNLRNEVSVISGYAGLLDEAGVALDRAATEISTTAYKLAEIGEKARIIERMMSEPPKGGTEVAVGTVVEQAVDRVQPSHPECSFAADVPDDLVVTANATVLVPVIENVVENAAEHNDADDPQVTVRATEGVDESTVTITVVDNGPGIPENERAVLESGDVTPLEHGSGLGLWIAEWGVTRLGGELSFAATEPRGTIVTIRIPVDGPTAEGVDVPAGETPAAELS